MRIASQYDGKKKRPRSPLTAIDLFSGCGGMTLGLKLANFSVLGAIEKESLPAETYHQNHPEVKIWESDIRDVSVTAIRRELRLRPGSLDLLAGCPPCQGFSAVRTLNGSRHPRDSRNDLILELLRFVRGLRPKVIMIENVPALARDWRIRTFRRELRGLGYESRVEVLDAAAYGVPQRRRRMILLASRGDLVPLADSSPIRTTVRDAISDLPQPGDNGDACHDLEENRTPRIERLIKRIPKDGGSRLDMGIRNQLPCHKKCLGFKDVYGRMAWDAVAPTITGGCVNPSKGRFIHPDQDRAITLREAAILQGFPRDYFFSMRRGKFMTAEMIGNALPPEFIRRHALTIANWLR